MEYISTNVDKVNNKEKIIIELVSFNAYQEILMRTQLLAKLTRTSQARKIYKFILNLIFNEYLKIKNDGFYAIIFWCIKSMLNKRRVKL